MWWQVYVSPGRRPAHRGTWRSPQRRGVLQLRRRSGTRPAQMSAVPSTCQRGPRAGRRRYHLAAVRPRDSAFRPGDDWRIGFVDRDRRFTLGGGIGHLVCRCTASPATTSSRPRWSMPMPQVLRAAADGEPGTVLGVRGGGGNFGVVTSLELAVPRRYDCPRRCRLLSRRSGRAGDLPLARCHHRRPEELTTTLNLIGAVPPLPFLPEAVHAAVSRR